MKKRISQAELDVMDVLWNARGKILAKEIAAKVPKSNKWSETTVKTLLRRLVDKGYVEHSPDRNRYLYTPLISQADYAQRMTHQLVDRLFGGRIGPMVAQMAERRGLSQTDISELEALIEAHKND